MCKEDDKQVAIVLYYRKAYGGPGWYYYDEDYQDEGVCGPFDTKEEAKEHAEEAGYKVEFINN